ncbi:MAG TPA: hypothetical protein VHF06_09360 [Pseudonocardiaceae bacterium]|nr:hypothetical protein [Pseudonocardiaceae bacterium]
MSLRLFTAAGAAVLVLSLAACDSSPVTGPDGSVRAPTALVLALSRVADDAGARTEIYYDDTSALVRLAGTRVTAQGFGMLRGTGAGQLQEISQVITDQPGIRLDKADFTILAGSPPREVGLVAGGQQDATITGNLTKAGWRQKGNTLVGPSPTSAGGDPNVMPLLALSMAKVRADGADLVYGESDADLDLIGGSGPTLATDPLIGAVANCLGDVVAAEIMAPYPGNHQVTVLATGVPRPKSNTDTPHAVVCTGWSSADAAGKYATLARQQLTTGTSVVTDEKYDTLLHNPSVTTVGGAAHLVRWEVETSQAERLFQMIENSDVPGLPDCSRLPPAAAAKLGAACQ